MNTGQLNSTSLNGSASEYVAPILVEALSTMDFMTPAVVFEQHLLAAVDAMFATDVLADSGYKLVSAAESLGVGATTTSQVVYTLYDVALLTSLARGPTAMTVRAVASLTTTDALELIRVVSIVDSFSLATDATTVRERLASVMDLLRLSSVRTYTQLELSVHAAAAVLLADSPARAVPAEAIDSLTASDAAAAKLFAMVTIAEAVQLASDTSSGRTAVVALRDTVGATADTTAPSELTVRIADAFAAGAELHLLGEVYDAWAVNAETGAASRYLNYSYDSLFVVQGKAFGCSNAGLFRLDGDTDNGDPVFARVLTGELDFGTTSIKRVEQAWIAYASNGDMILKAIVRRARGEREEHWYRSKAGGKDFSEAKIALGRGLDSHYWQFELVNAGGADFELDGLQFSALALTRRI